MTDLFTFAVVAFQRLNIVVQFKQHAAFFIIADHRLDPRNDALTARRGWRCHAMRPLEDTTPDRLPGVLPDVARRCH